MTPRIVKANYVKDYTLYLCFSDGTEGKVDFEQELEGEIFKPLRDASYFRTLP